MVMPSEEENKEETPETKLYPIVAPPKIERTDEHDTRDLFVVSDEDVLGEGGEQGLAEAVEVTSEDIIGSSDEDMCEELFSVPDEPDVADLVEVTNEDIMGGAPCKPRKPKIVKRFKRTTKRYTPPEGGMSGMRF